MTLVIGSPLPTLMFVATAALVVAACDVNVSIGDDTTRRTEHEVVERGDVESVTIDTEDGRVEVRAGADDEIRIEALLDENDAGDASYAVDNDGSELAIRGTCDAGRFDRCRVGFVIHLPADVAVQVRTSNGAIEIDDVGGGLDARSSNGAITAERITSEHVELRTSNGRVLAQFASAPRAVAATTSNGSIAIAVPDDGVAYAVDADSNNGAIDIDVAERDDSGRRIDADSHNGSVTIEYSADD